MPRYGRSNRKLPPPPNAIYYVPQSGDVIETLAELENYEGMTVIVYLSSHQAIVRVAEPRVMLEPVIKLEKKQ